MEFHRGRLLDHVQLEVEDLEVSKRFYRAVIEAIGRTVTGESPSHFNADELWITEGHAPTQRIHLAFSADDEDTVRRFHAAALKAGGIDNGPPGPRDYHPGYYAAYAFDPDGNNVECVHHGPATKSSESVVLTAPDPPGA